MFININNVLIGNRICRPFCIPFSMKTGVIITIVEIGLGVVLSYRGIAGLL